MPSVTQLSFQQGASGYTGGRACQTIAGSINEEITSLLRCTNGYVSIVGFNLSSVPAGANILSANLILRIYETNNAGGVFQVGRINDPDLSGLFSDLGLDSDDFNKKATYRRKIEETAVKWSNFGAAGNISDVLNAPDDSFTPTQFQVTTKSFNVKSSVAAWISGAASNAGFYIKPGATDPNCRIRGNYYGVVGERPLLVITYGVGSSSSSSSSCRSSSSSSCSSSSSSRSSSSSSRSSSSSCRSSSSSSLVSSSSSCRSSSSSCRSSSSSSSSISGQFQNQVFSTGNLADIPTDDIDLAVPFDTTAYSEVAVQDGSYYGSDGLNEYLFILFKNTVTPATPFTVTWRGKTSIACATSTVFLQILNRNLNVWETLASNTTTVAGTDFTLSATKNTGMSDYLDTNNQISCRIYQELIYD